MSDQSNGHRYDAEAMDAVLFRRVEEHEEQLAGYRVDLADILVTSREVNARICKQAERIDIVLEALKRHEKLLEAIAATVGAL